MQRSEQETTVAWPNEGDVVYIYSTVPKHLRKLRARTGIEQGPQGEDWGLFEVPRDQFDPLTGFRRAKRVMTPEAREAAVARLVAARKAKA